MLARKDTRRFRYRTSIVVGNIIRYFDTMRIQRFRGILIYVNNGQYLKFLQVLKNVILVERGQADIYVVLEEAQVFNKKKSWKWPFFQILDRCPSSWILQHWYRSIDRIPRVYGHAEHRLVGPASVRSATRRRQGARDGVSPTIQPAESVRSDAAFPRPNFGQLHADDDAEWRQFGDL